MDDKTFWQRHCQPTVTEWVRKGEMDMELSAMQVKDNAEYVAGLRQLADWYEKNPQVELPSWQFTVYAFDTKENAMLVLRACAPCDKEYDGDMFYIRKQFGKIGLNFMFLRQAVCVRRVVGTRDVPEVVIPKKVVPAHVEQIVEWDCVPVLSAESA